MDYGDRRVSLYGVVLRMLFEAMIAYFDMHSYLEQLAHTTGGV